MLKEWLKTWLGIKGLEYEIVWVSEKRERELREVQSALATLRDTTADIETRVLSRLNALEGAFTMGADVNFQDFQVKDSDTPAFTDEDKL